MNSTPKRSATRSTRSTTFARLLLEDSDSKRRDLASANGPSIFDGGHTASSSASRSAYGNFPLLLNVLQGCFILTIKDVAQAKARGQYANQFFGKRAPSVERAQTGLHLRTSQSLYLDQEGTEEQRQRVIVYENDVLPISLEHACPQLHTFEQARSGQGTIASALVTSRLRFPRDQSGGLMAN